MTVFKGYMRIMKKNTGLILLYLGIFFGVTMALQAAAGKETYTSYESEKIKIGVVDKDNGPLAEGLVKWLEGTHHVTMLEDNREKLQEELFYRNVEYIVVIPEDFYENCMVNGESISVTKVPGSYSAYYVDQQLESCLNTMRTYLKAGFSQKEAATACGHGWRPPTCRSVLPGTWPPFRCPLAFSAGHPECRGYSFPAS